MSTPTSQPPSKDDEKEKLDKKKVKLRRLNELNTKLEEELNRPRIPVSKAANDLIKFTEEHQTDFMVPSKWGKPDKEDNPYAGKKKWRHCIVM